MSLKMKIDYIRARSQAERLQLETVSKMRKEIDVFKCCDMILKSLALGAIEEAENMCNILYRENTLDPIKENFTDNKSRKIQETCNLVAHFKKNIAKSK